MSYKKQIVVGYYNHTAYYDKHLAECYYGSCGVDVEVHDGKVYYILVSYISPIIRYCPEDSTIDFYRTSPSYSRTTIKHVIAFLREYIPSLSYYDIKRAYAKDDMNPHTWTIDEILRQDS